MSSGIGSSGGSGSSKSTRDLQDAYEQRRQELKEHHERELQNIQEQNRKQIAKAKEAGEASVNHIRKRVDEQQSEFTKQQQGRKLAVLEEVETDLEQIQETGTKKIQETKLRSAEEKARLEEDHQKRTENLQSTYKSTYDRMKSSARSRAEEIEQESQKTIESKRNTYAAQNDQLRKRYMEAVQKEQQSGDTRIQTVREKQQAELQKTVEHAAKTNEKVHNQYEHENQRIILTGEEKLKSREELNDQLIKEQKVEHKTELEKTVQANESVIAQKHQEYEKRKNEQAKVQRENLLRQRENFVESQTKLGQTHKQHLESQDRMLHRELYKKQLEYQTNFDKIEARKEDPFYKSLDFTAKLSESEGAYTFTAKVPAHEVDNVDVKVKGNKVTITNQRRFEDRKEFDNQIATTNSYQSQRQEFKLAIPVDAKRITKERDKDGNIVVKIPKMGAVET
jgi:HSP20 family molecular chaperone IbpA